MSCCPPPVVVRFLNSSIAVTDCAWYDLFSCADSMPCFPVKSSKWRPVFQPDDHDYHLFLQLLRHKRKEHSVQKAPSRPVTLLTANHENFSKWLCVSFLVRCFPFFTLCTENGNSCCSLGFQGSINSWQSSVDNAIFFTTHPMSACAANPADLGQHCSVFSVSSRIDESLDFPSSTRPVPPVPISYTNSISW